MERVIIIGGGVAGLTCLNALLDCGISAILFEGGTVGHPKMCGEFIAPAAVLLLQRWGISAMQSIEHASFMIGNKKLDLPFLTRAGALSRSQAELQLAECAKAKGGEIRENSPIQSMTPQEGSYTFQLASGEVIETEYAMIATGRFMDAADKIDFSYYGIKAHFPTVIHSNHLLMYSAPDIYFGLVPVSEATSNWACLAKKNIIEKAGSVHDFFYDLASHHPILQKIHNKEVALLESKIPKFGFKSQPYLPNIFRMGDALASFPPAMGYGFAHGVESAMMAVEYFLKNDSRAYFQISRKQAQSKLKIGNMIHTLLLNPGYAALALPVLQTNPWITHLLMKKIGY